MKNIILIGMPGAGKSTVGVLLAKKLLMSFTDTDLIIQKQYEKPLCDILKAHGKQEFIRMESEVLCSLEVRDSVIATGGSAVYTEKAMRHLKQNGITVYLKLSSDEIKDRIDNLNTRGIAMDNGETLDDIFAERAPLYEKYADIIICCSGLSVGQCADKIAESL